MSSYGSGSDWKRVYHDNLEKLDRTLHLLSAKKLFICLHLRRKFSLKVCNTVAPRIFIFGVVVLYDYGRSSDNVRLILVIYDLDSADIAGYDMQSLVLDKQMRNFGSRTYH